MSKLDPEMEGSNVMAHKGTYGGGKKPKGGSRRPTSGKQK